MIFARGFNIIGEEVLISHDLELLCYKKFLGNVSSVIYMQERGHFVPHCRLRNGSSRCAVVFPK